MLETLKQDVRRANIHLTNQDVDSFLRGSISAIDRVNSLVVISPSGIFYDEITADMMIVADFAGEIVEGALSCADDVKTHIEIYKAFENIGGIVSLHTPFATAWAQSGRDILPYGDFHVSNFRGSIPCSRSLSAQEIETDYEKNVGLVICETFQKRGIDEMKVSGVNVFNCGPYAWGIDAFSAVYNAITLENVAKTAYLTEKINPDVTTVSKAYIERNF